MRRPGGWHLGLRDRLLSFVLLAIGLVLAALTAGFNLVLADRLDASATGVVQARATAELAALRISHGRIALPEPPTRPPRTPRPGCFRAPAHWSVLAPAPRATRPRPAWRVNREERWTCR